MFTGIIETTGKLIKKEMMAQNMNFIITPEKEEFLKEVKIGSSINVNGVCLTATQLDEKKFQAFIGTETFQLTNLKDLSLGSLVNLEKALSIQGRLDGHLVAGHIDNVGTISQIYKVNKDYQLGVRLPVELLKYIVPKGSLAINGISLTIAKIQSDEVFFSIIPETFMNTNVPKLKVGDKVNIEIDMIAKYIWHFIKNQ